MRILQVMRAPVGGLFRHVADLTRTLAARGHEMGLAVDSLSGDSRTEEQLTALLPHVSLGIHRFPMPRLLGGGDLLTPLRIRQLAGRLGVQVLHGHGAKGGFYARLARLAGGRAVAIYTPHGGVLHFSRESRSGRIFHGLEKRLMAQTSAIIFESEYARKTYAALIGTPSCPTAVVHNGLAPEEFDAVQQRADAADFVFVGELRELKGVHVLLDALAEVRRSDGTPATLLMAGEGSSRAEVEAQIGRLGLSSRVEMPGAQPARAMFERGRIAVVPSLAESLPYVVLEAAAAGLPVIATRVGGIPEIYGPTASSLVPPGDAQAFQSAMQHALDQPDKVADEAVQRLDHIRQHFSAETMSDQIEALYRHALVKA
jgi:glycosyltransferase involved in cell wall biosynthesis